MFLVDADENLDAPIEIARHEVSAAEEDLLFVAGAEREES